MKEIRTHTYIAHGARLRERWWCWCWWKWKRLKDGLIPKIRCLCKSDFVFILNSSDLGLFLSICSQCVVKREIERDHRTHSVPTSAQIHTHTDTQNTHASWIYNIHHSKASTWPVLASTRSNRILRKENLQCVSACVRAGTGMGVLGDSLSKAHNSIFSFICLQRVSHFLIYIQTHTRARTHTLLRFSFSQSWCWGGRGGQLYYIIMVFE